MICLVVIALAYRRAEVGALAKGRSALLAVAFPDVDASGKVAPFRIAVREVQDSR